MGDTVDEGLVADQQNISALIGDPSQIVTARGTEDGLVLRIDGRTEWEAIKSELTIFLGGRKRFLEGGQVSIEWLDQLPTKEQSQELENFLREDYGISIATRKKNPRGLSSVKNNDASAKGTSEAVPLFDQIEKERVPGGESSGVFSQHGEPSGLEFSVEEFAATQGVNDNSTLSQVTELLGEESLFEDEANSRIYFGTLRSGQRIETPFTLVVVGDVNPGADLIAGGDIIVVGSLRGTAHASAYDDDCQDRTIIALQMQPMQLRLGSVISRGNDDPGQGPEVARIDDRRIIVEPFNPRAIQRYKR